MNTRQKKARQADHLSTATDSQRRPIAQGTSPPVFVVDESFFRVRNPRSMHWSIAWADLMMTMFILFLTLFVYQVAHREFLSKEEYPVIVAGSAIDIPAPPSPLPFYPIYPDLSSKPGDKIKKVEPVSGDIKEEKDALPEKMHDGAKEALEPSPPVPRTGIVISDLDILAAPESTPQPPHASVDQQSSSTTQQREVISEIYDLSQYTVANEKLEKFASVELIPDKTLRIILTGDLLFPSGQADLTGDAMASLAKLVPVIRQAPHLINVIGHTDSVPMHSEKYASNWELSTARASRVARFLIEEGGIPAKQLVVSGYSYLRPVKPNTTENNRRANRRVEIILTREPEPMESSSPNNALSPLP